MDEKASTSIWSWKCAFQIVLIAAVQLSRRS